MALTTLKFADTIVDVLVIRQSETYGGVLEGKISSRRNERIIQNAKAKADYLWPSVPVFCIPPSEKDGRLPNVLCFALLEQNDVDSEPIRFSLLHFEDSYQDQFSASTRNRIGRYKWAEVGKTFVN